MRHLQRAWGIPLLVVRARTASTNDDARKLAEAGAAAGSVVLTDAQTAGRGRRGRPWLDQPGRSVLLSMVWRPTGGAAGAAPLRAGLAVARAVEQVSAAPDGAEAVRVRIKWPNDVLLGHRKLAGILCESVLGGPEPYVIVGVGLNVLQLPHEFPAELAGTATSLRAALGGRPSRLAVAEALIRTLAETAPRATDALHVRELAEIGERDALLGRPVAVNGAPLGSAAGVAADGALRVRGADGREVEVRHGTVRTLDDAEVEQ